ncbi:hypothetical protein VP01_1225g15 [Puccinia sorghi]|uniref:Uncharacterized protein n=1 Tax=Puccinia sorghi TaxID=27349 RepID=A0A0L6VPY1_9BASI|nr:hypothetical protein VP01_1225g15 [Puccinia sorghi]
MTEDMKEEVNDLYYDFQCNIVRLAIHNRRYDPEAQKHFDKWLNKIHLTYTGENSKAEYKSVMNNAEDNPDRASGFNGGISDSCTTPSNS